jgi:hypothetical protein
VKLWWRRGIGGWEERGEREKMRVMGESGVEETAAGQEAGDK